MMFSALGAIVLEFWFCYLRIARREEQGAHVFANFLKKLIFRR
jgi:hypothetical protein